MFNALNRLFLWTVLPVRTSERALLNLSKPRGNYTYHQFNIQQFYVLPTQYLCVLCGSQNKRRLIPYTALTDWFLKQRFNTLKPCGHYMYHQFNTQQFYVLPTQCTRSVRKVSDRIFLCEHLMDYNLARLHEPTLNLSAHA